MSNQKINQATNSQELPATADGVWLSVSGVVPKSAYEEALAVFDDEVEVFVLAPRVLDVIADGSTFCMHKYIFQANEIHRLDNKSFNQKQCVRNVVVQKTEPVVYV